MKIDNKAVKKTNPKELIGKFFMLNKTKQKWIEGWISIERNLKQFLRNIQEEIEYERDFNKLNFEIYYIDTNTNKMIQIKDDKILQSTRRFEKILIVILDKTIKINKITDIEPLNTWYQKNLLNYES